MRTAAELAARLAKPSLLLGDDPDDAVATNAAGLGLRLYLGSRDGDADILETLTAAHVLDSTMERVEGTGALLEPCRPHLVVAHGKVFACARQRLLGRRHTGLDPGAPPSWHPDVSLCAGCIADTVARMGPSLVANRRRGEGRELALRVSAALLDHGRHHAAAEVARTAAELSETGSERADALIQSGLCHLAGGAFGDADRALLEAADFGAAAGLVAYHRARVQVAWRDDIEALDRFAEALALGTDAVSTEDLHFEMALSHIRLEEWADARAHLEQAGGPSATIAFNLGVCDVNDGRAGRALDHFDRALSLGPAAEDLGRIRFFRGFCLNKLERFEEAAEDLRRSINLEEPELAHHNLLGFCFFKLGRHAEAVASFERAVAVDPTSAIDWANIAVNLEKLGETERAAEMYRKALGMDGSIGFAREGLERVGG
jgi:tetratricopeptide (TPR) repeat protein